MTGNKHPLVREDAEKKEQRHSELDKADVAFRSRKEAEEHDADMADRKVRFDTVEDVRRMRPRVAWFAIGLVVVMFSVLHVQIAYYRRLLAPSKDGVAEKTDANTSPVEAVVSLADAKMVEALSAPMTALIAGTYTSITVICAALLFGLFRNILGSAKKDGKKETMADMHPATSATRTFLGGNE